MTVQRGNALSSLTFLYIYCICFSHFLLIIVVVIIIIIIIIIVWLNRHLINQNTCMNLLHLNMDFIFAYCYNYTDEESQEFPVFVGLRKDISSA